LQGFGIHLRGAAKEQPLPRGQSQAVDAFEDVNASKSNPIPRLSTPPAVSD